MGGESKKIKAMRVRAERRGLFSKFIIGWWFRLYTIAPWRGVGAPQ